MEQMKTFNGYEIVDAQARDDIANINTPTKVSELENDKGYLTEIPDTYATKEYVAETIAGSAQPEVDLSGYYTKEEVNALFNGIATAEGGSY